MIRKLLFLLLPFLLFASNKAILKLDTKGHTALIRDIVVTSSGDIISGSDDKTIRVWDKDGKEKRKILGQVGSGSEGKIFAIALSGDEKYLAVGGFINSGNNERIRIYDYQSEKLLQVLKSHKNVVSDLSFSSDSRYLISGSADKSAKIWDVRDGFTLSDTITFHDNHVYGVKIIKKSNRYFAVTAGEDNKIALYDMQRKKVIKSDKSDYQLQFLGVNEVNGDIAVCGTGQEIRIYDNNLDLLKVIKSETVPEGLHYSKDGKFLIAGSGTSPRNVNIYNVNDGYSLKSTFKKHTNLTMAVNFLDNSTAVSGGGNNNEIYIWDINTLKVKSKIEGVGARIWSVGIDGNKVALGNVFDAQGDYHKKQSSFKKQIDLNGFKVSNISGENGFKRINTKNGSYSLSHSRGGDYGKSDASLDIYKNGSKVSSIVRGATDGYEHRCYGWYKDLVVSGGNNGILKIYNKEGKEVASLIGHSGEVWSIALDGDRLVSGSGDQTMMVWDLSKLGMENGELAIDDNIVSLIMKQLKWTKQQIIDNADLIKEKTGINIYFRNSQKLYPILNIFVSKNDEYVAWTKEGFFDASKNGAKYIGYHINQGANKEAKYVSVDKLYDTYYRPDLIAKVIKGEDISSYAKGIDINKLLNSGLAPEVKILTKSKRSDKRDINLELEVCTVDDGGYDNLTLLLDGMAVDVLSPDRALKLKKQSKSRKECFSFEKLISLQSGKNVIGFKATNKAGNIESNLDEITVSYQGRSNAKPNLYILSVGIDKYRDKALWLNYSKADANGFNDAIKKVAKPLFENIYEYKLLDRDVTKNKILDTFKEIGSKTTREDVFVFYMAGHGKTDDKTGSYFYIPVDFRYKNENSIREKGVSQQDLTLAFSKIQAMKSITILDTCNSGSFVKDTPASRGMTEKTAINKLTRATGRTILVASSEDQVALEGYNGHGVFTYTLIEALNGKAYGSDNKITIKELAAYIEDTIPDRTYEKWGYEQVPQSNITGNDFPIGVK